MNFRKRLERGLKMLLLAPPTLLRYGTIRPSRVKFSDSDHWIHINPQDRRAIKKFIHDPIRKRVSPPLTFWRDFLDKLEPAIAMDVGMNYGECLFGSRYAGHTRVFGFEANPRLTPYLSKSRDDHPDSASITIIEGLVSDKLEDSIPFYASPTWSGTGSAVRSLNNGADVVTSSISSRTLDSVIPREQVMGKNLLFKMDIEGYESKAFSGFEATLDAAKLAVGFIEFDTTYVREAGTDPAAFYASLEQRFDIHRLMESRPKHIIKIKHYADLPVSRATDQRIHTDLLLSTRGIDHSEWLPSGWTIAPAE